MLYVYAVPRKKRHTVLNTRTHRPSSLFHNLIQSIFHATGHEVPDTSVSTPRRSQPDTTLHSARARAVCGPWSLAQVAVTSTARQRRLNSQVRAQHQGRCNHNFARAPSYGRTPMDQLDQLSRPCARCTLLYAVAGASMERTAATILAHSSAGTPLPGSS